MLFWAKIEYNHFQTQNKSPHPSKIPLNPISFNAMDSINQKNSALSEILAEFGFLEVKTGKFCENNAKIDHFGPLFAQ